MSSRTGSAPDAIGIYLVERRLGLSTHFISAATEVLQNNGGIRTPIEFFDTAYKADSADAKRAHSLLSDLLVQASETRRVAQPFYIRHGLEPENRERVSSDLVEHLETAVMDPDQGPKLRIIEGNAGIGKSVAFNALVKELYGEFIEAKRARHGRRRPIVFLPNHLRGERIGYVNDVIEAVMSTDVADAVKGEQLTWLLKNGYSIWMFDGFDEFYAGSNDLFSFIDEALAAPGSKAQFVICTRDSLVSSSTVLRSFVERHLASGTDVEIYEVAPWDSESWREVAWLELERGREGARDSERVLNFVSALESSENISKLAQLPFYCSALLERFRTEGTLPVDEFEVIEFLVDQMFDREQGKGVFRWKDFVDLDRLEAALKDEISSRGEFAPTSVDVHELVDQLLNAEGRDILLELVGEIAHTHRCNGSAGAHGESLSTEDIGKLSGLVNVPFQLNAEVVSRLRTVMIQLAFFGPGRKAGSVDFTHQILADYFAARHAVKLLKRESRSCTYTESEGATSQYHLPAFEAAMRKALGTNNIAKNSLFFRYLAREIRRDPQLWSLLEATRSQSNWTSDDGASQLLN